MIPMRENERGVLVAASVGAALWVTLLLVWAEAQPRMFLSILLSLATLGFTLLVWREPSLLLLPGLYVVFGWGGYLLAPYLNARGVGNFYAGRLSGTDFVHTLTIFQLAGLGLLMGASLGVLFFPLSGGSEGSGKALLETVRRPLASAPMSLNLGVCIAPPLLVSIAVGPVNMLVRETYHVESSWQTLAVIGNMLMLPGVVIAGALWHVRPAARYPAAMLLLVYAAVAFANASRFLAIIPPLWLLGGSLAGTARRRTRRVFLGVACGGFGLLLLQIPLHLRGQAFGRHGLLPYLDTVLEHPELVIGGDGSDSVGNIFFGFQLTAFIIASSFEAPSNTLPVSLSPLPGFLTNWDSVKLSLNVNRAVPLNALGELAAHSYLVLLLYFVAMGLSVSASLWRLRSLPVGVPRALATLAQAGLLAMFFLTSMQYNLRSTTRFAYYALAVTLIAGLVTRKREVDVRQVETSAARSGFRDTR